MPNSDNAKPEIDLASFRKALRTRLIAAREALTPAEHARASAAIESHLERLLARLAPAVLGFCWPFRAEFDCRPLASRLNQRGVITALPVVLDRHQPLEFHRWQTDSTMVEGAYGIAVPAQGAVVTPSVILLPVNGFDGAGYRLGYGGGYFDRTLAALQPAPISIGVGFELGRVASIQPQSYDARLDWLVTEAGAQQVTG